MTEIFMDNFDWDTAFKDLEETGKDYDDELHKLKNEDLDTKTIKRKRVNLLR